MNLKNTIFDITVSCFKNSKDNQGREISLLDWFRPDPDLVKLQERIRAETDPKKQAELKKQMPMITPSALLKHRNKDTPLPEKIIRYTGFMCIDIDRKENLHFRADEWKAVFSDLQRIEQIAYAGRSVRGEGYWILLPIYDPGKLGIYHISFIQILEYSFNIIADASKGGNPTDARFYSYTPDEYFNPQAKVYSIEKTIYDKPKPPPQRKTRPHSHNATSTDIEAYISIIEAHRIDITAQWEDWIKIGFAIASSYGNAGREYFHRISRFYPGYSDEDTDRKYSEILKTGTKRTSIGSFYYLCHQYGIRPEKIAATKQGNASPISTPTQPAKAPQEAPQEATQRPQQAMDETYHQPRPYTPPTPPQPKQWEEEINELETYFAGLKIPHGMEIRLNGYSIVRDATGYIESHLCTVRANDGNPTFLPYLYRMRELKQVFTSLHSNQL